MKLHHIAREQKREHLDHINLSMASTDETSNDAPPPEAVAAPEASAPESAEKERRAAIQAIMRDNSLSAMEQRRSIPNLMDGRRRSSLVSFQRCSSIASRRDSMGMEIGGPAKTPGLYRTNSPTSMMTSRRHPLTNSGIHRNELTTMHSPMKMRRMCLST